MPNAFVDTNILVYAADERSPVSRKTTIARELLLLPAIHFSVQVLNEFIASARNPRKLGLSTEQEADWVDKPLSFPIVPLNSHAFVNAIALHLHYQISHWDALIVAEAQECHCETLYSEDLSHGQDYGGIIVRNPFA